METEASRLKEIIRLDTELSTVQDLDILLERILTEARKITNSDAGTIYIKRGDNLVFSYAQNATQQKKLPPGQKLIYSTFTVKINTKSISGYVAAKGKALNIPDMYKIPKDSPYQFDSSYDKVSQYKTTSTLTAPLKTNMGEIVGVLQIINKQDSDEKVIPFDSEDEVVVQHFASTATMALQRAQLTRALILRMIQMAELRDPKETGPHVNRVAAFATEIYERWASRRSIPSEVINKNRDVLRSAAMLHDVGKVGISDVILKKPGRFTDEEREIMKAHTYIGARLFVNPQSEFDEIASIAALTHHENWDGTGYPGVVEIATGEPVLKGRWRKPAVLKGEDIPIYGRVVAIADVYDALMSKRVYKEAWDTDEVYAELRKMSGQKFDPEIVDVFFSCSKLIKAIYNRYPDPD
ncbi:MAG: HD domain-containing protein [Spirochaetota bacterium]|nr:MAG: HD domain-containing protein [Spirochaetota bacterium]